MRQLIVILFFVLTLPALAQDSTAVSKKGDPDFDAYDLKYREDQFYFGFTYDILQNLPGAIEQNKFSSGYSFGFLRDMPFNQKRTWAIAAGLGASIHNLNHNLLITHNANDYQYSAIDSDVNFDKNKLVLTYLELPLEIRWRTSTEKTHKFWRIYTGFKLSYLVYSRYKFKSGGEKYILENIDDLNRIQYGMYLATGFNTWNLNVYYGFNPIFKSDAQLEGENIDMQMLNIGLMFYIL